LGEVCAFGDVVCEMQHAHWQNAANEAAYAAAVVLAREWSAYELQVPRLVCRLCFSCHPCVSLGEGGTWFQI
jgi:hypothetical protein